MHGLEDAVCDDPKRILFGFLREKCVLFGLITGRLQDQSTSPDQVLR